MLTKSYKMVVDPPPATPWKEYARQVETEWNALLNSPAGEIEANIQAFLETHPSMVPGALSMSGHSGHAPFPAALIRQPKLPGFNHTFPDFMWLAADSDTMYAVVVEIESPKKKWFNKNGTQTAEFSQAHNQLTEWRMWFDRPLNQQAFLDHYGPPEQQRRRFLPQYVLIYGRRAEFDGRPHLAKKWSFLKRDNEYFMSFDRLHAIASSDQYVTVESKADGYRAISVPATVQLGPAFAAYRARIANKEQAVDKNPLMSEERKAFLKERFEYWDDYARGDGKLRSMNTGDLE